MRYRVTQTGWLDGDYRHEGDVVEMTEAAAKWLVLGGQVVPADAPATPRPPAEGRSRKKAAD